MCVLRRACLRAARDFCEMTRDRNPGIGFVSDIPAAVRGVPPQYLDAVVGVSGGRDPTGQDPAMRPGGWFR